MAYTCLELGEHEQLPCDDYSFGGISAIGIALSGSGLSGADFSDASLVEAAITAGTFRVIKGIKAELPEPSEVEGENPTFNGSDNILDGFDYVLNISDANISGNNDTFYVALNQQRNAKLVMYFVEEDNIRVVEKSVKFKMKYFAAGGRRDKQMYRGTASWYANVAEAFPVLMEAPVGIFTDEE